MGACGRSGKSATRGIWGSSDRLQTLQTANQMPDLTSWPLQIGWSESYNRTHFIHRIIYNLMPTIILPWSRKRDRWDWERRGIRTTTIITQTNARSPRSYVKFHVERCEQPTLPQLDLPCNPSLMKHVIAQDVGFGWSNFATEYEIRWLHFGLRQTATPAQFCGGIAKTRGQLTEWSIARWSVMIFSLACEH